MIIITIAFIGLCLMFYFGITVALYWRREYIKAYLSDYKTLRRKERAVNRLPALMEQLKAEKAALAEEKAKEKHRAQRERKEITEKVKADQKAERERVKRERKESAAVNQ